MAIYSEFSHSKWWFSIVTLVYQRVSENLMTWFLSQFICHWMFDQQKHPAWRICSHTSPEKKTLANKCSISNKSLAKMELLKHRSLYSLLLYNSSPGRSGAPWRWPIGIFRSLPKMLNFNINHPGHSNGKNTSKWLLDCQSIKSVHDCRSLISNQW